jgi:hypothetical protein
MSTTEDQPSFDAELYSFATLRIEEQAALQIRECIDADRLSRWFGDKLRHAYGAGVRDGYVQGRHDRHKDGVGEGRAEAR